MHSSYQLLHQAGFAEIVDFKSVQQNCFYYTWWNLILFFVVAVIVSKLHVVDLLLTVKAIARCISRIQSKSVLVISCGDTTFFLQSNIWMCFVPDHLQSTCMKKWYFFLETFGQFVASKIDMANLENIETHWSCQWMYLFTSCTVHWKLSITGEVVFTLVISIYHMTL